MYEGTPSFSRTPRHGRHLPRRSAEDGRTLSAAREDHHHRVHGQTHRAILPHFATAHTLYMDSITWKKSAFEPSVSSFLRLFTHLRVLYLLDYSAAKAAPWISPAEEILPVNVAASYSLSLAKLSFEQATGRTELLSWLRFSCRVRMLATTAKNSIALANRLRISALRRHIFPSY
jgi:hypothetical protein